MSPIAPALSLRLDGKLDEAAWQAAPWTDDFVDIEGDRRLPPRFRTRVKMLWDDRYFYFGAELEEPHVQGTYTQHDSHVFHKDNEFEVFIDPDGDNHNYAELEINALNTTWDLRMRKPYRDGGKAEDHWEIPGVKTAVHVQGMINNPRDVDKAWTIEIAIPWDMVRALDETNRSQAMPRDGDQWRINFSRVEWRFDIVNGRIRTPKGPSRGQLGLVAARGCGHAPARHLGLRPVLDFSRRVRRASTPTQRAQPSTCSTASTRPSASFQKQHGRYASTLGELGADKVSGERIRCQESFLCFLGRPWGRTVV